MRSDQALANLSKTLAQINDNCSHSYFFAAAVVYCVLCMAYKIEEEEARLCYVRSFYFIPTHVRAASWFDGVVRLDRRLTEGWVGGSSVLSAKLVLWS